MPDSKTHRVVNIRVPVELHRRIRVLAALQDRSLRDYALAAVEEKVDRDESTSDKDLP